MSELAVQGCEFEIYSLDPLVTSISAESITAVSLASTKVLAENKGVYFDKISVLISTAEVSKEVSETTGRGTLVSGTLDITGTASNILDSNGNKAVQENDYGTSTLQFTFTTTSTPPSTVSVGISVSVKVKKAGQDKVIAS